MIREAPDFPMLWYRNAGLKQTHTMLLYNSTYNTYQLLVKQPVQDNSSSLLDVNAMSAVPEDPEDPDWKVSNSVTLDLYVGLQCNLSGWKKLNVYSQSIEHKATVAKYLSHIVDVNCRSAD